MRSSAALLLVLLSVAPSAHQQEGWSPWEGARLGNRAVPKGQVAKKTHPSEQLSTAASELPKSKARMAASKSSQGRGSGGCSTPCGRTRHITGFSGSSSTTGHRAGVKSPRDQKARLVRKPVRRDGMEEGGRMRHQGRPGGWVLPTHGEHGGNVGRLLTGGEGG